MCKTHPYQAWSHRSFVLLIMVLFSCLCVQAQEHSQYDRGTPPQHAAGVSSFGSYASADIGNVNLSNGALNFKLPLGAVGGRGFSLPITLNYSSKVWSASRGSDTDNSQDTGPIERKVVYASYAEADLGSDFYNLLAPGWTVGAQPVLRARTIEIGHFPNSCVPAYKLTKLTLILPDKGEVELRDDQTNGAPIAVPSNSGCVYRDGYRGPRWHAADGSGLIYVADSNNGPVQGFLAGVVIASDGTRYRFEDGPEVPFGVIGMARCHSITDRNGNRMTISYQSGEMLYTDQLGRVTKVQRGAPDPENPSVNLDLLVTLPGYGGQPRYYKVKFGMMNELYRDGINPGLPVGTGTKDSDIAPHGYDQFNLGTKLFPNSWGKYLQVIDSHSVVSELVLPDGRSLQFKYNQYGEVAEVQLPTGGKVQYDYGPATLPTGNTQNWEKAVLAPNMESDVFDIDRALSTRRTYPDGSTLEGTWTYTYGLNATEVQAHGTNGLLLRQKHYFLLGSRYLGLQFEDPDGSGYNLWSTGLEYRTETLDASGTIISASEQDWSQRVPLVWTTGYQQEQPENDNRVNEARSILDTGQTARRTFLYDQFNNPTETSEFDFDNTLKRRTVISYSSTNLVNGVNYADDSIRLIRLPLQQSIYDGSAVEQARTVTEYDIYTSDGNHLILESYGAVPGSISGHDTANYGTTKTTRGNATTVGRWIKSSNTYLFTYPRFDILGNVVSAKDARGNVSTISFADDFGNGSNPGSGANNPATPTYAMPTFIESPPPNPGEPKHTARSQYDFSTGLLTGFKDRNNVVTQTIYDDSFNRPTLVKSALGVSGVESHTRMYYAPATVFGITLGKSDVLAAKDQTTLGDATLRSWNVTDGFGRTKEAWSRDPQGDLKVVTNYDALGRARQTSNPFRPSLGESAVFTTTIYDPAGRVTTVTTPDTAFVTTSYIGNTVTVTDQTGKERKSVTDALGRLKEVYEAPNDPGYNYLTSYSYDALDSLRRVSQGTQSRYFMYDSLKRLIRAKNPEQGNLATDGDFPPLTDAASGTSNSDWSMAYNYDENGNLEKRKDARNITVTYFYDALNRNTLVNYSDTATNPDITRVYDTAPNGKGHLCESYSGGNETLGTTVEHTKIHSYDAAGRPLDQRQRFKTDGAWSSEVYKTLRTYNLSGGVTLQTYPSGRTVTYSYDAAGRTSSFSGNLGDGGDARPYSTGIIYSPFGGMVKEQFGTDTPIYNKSFYNSRGQLSEIRVSTSYTGPTDTDFNRGAVINHYSNNCWGKCDGPNDTMPDNNGNLKKQGVHIPSEPERWQQYEYDKLNRISWVREISGGSELWKQTYLYDQYGNRRIDTSQTSGFGINNLGTEVETPSNRLYAPGDLALSESARKIRYDGAGNQTKDHHSVTGENYDRTYDAENRMNSATRVGFTPSVYTCNADGQRVRRKVDNEETWQIYGFDGELLAEYPVNGVKINPQKEYGYRNGQLLVTATGGAGWGSPPEFNDPSLLGGITVQSRHITELRTAISSLRTHLEMSPFVWQHSAEPGDWIKADPILEMRTALDQALGAPPAPGYSAGLGQNLPVLAIHIQELRNRVLNAWVSGSSLDINWFVTDQLGTPRMVIGKTGSLGSVKRHDYLPFGEELVEGVGGRTPGQGYVGDAVRQKFTAKERDIETGLDYFEARYYASMQGRFTSVDPLLASAKRRSPQTWNRYSYGLNNPLRYTDPDGEAAVDENPDLYWRRTITTTEVTVQDADRRGNVTQQAKVTITETKIESLNADGQVDSDPITVTTAAAENTGVGRAYSQDQLNTMANVAQNVVEVSHAKQFDPTIALGIANTETRLGTAPPGESAAHKQPNINPMQLSATSGTTATTDPRSNIAGSINVFNTNSAATNTLNQRLQDYNRESTKVAYANKAERQINQIRQSVKTKTQMIRFSIF